MNRNQSQNPSWHGRPAHVGPPLNTGKMPVPLVALLLALAGCKVGPNYQTPATATPDHWPAATQAASQPSVTTPQPLQNAQWWSTFNDAQLTALVQSAIAGNLDLRIAAARVLQARSSRGVAAAGLFPTLDTSANATRSRVPVPGGGVTGNAFLAGFDAAWEMDVFGGVRRNIEAADADTIGKIESLRDVQVTLAAEVATNYITLRALQEELRIAEENLADDRSNLELTQKRFAGGLVGKLDVSNAQAQVATTESQIPAIRSSIQQTIYALGVLLGQQPEALTEKLAAAGPIPTAPAVVPIGLPSDLLRRRPDIRAAEAQIHGATARIGVATADLFPKLSLTGDLSFSSATLTSFANWNNRAWSVGPAATWNIFDAGRIANNIDLQKELRDESVLTYQKTVLTAFQEVDAALAAYGNEQVRRESLANAVEANKQALDFAQQLYKEGHTDFLNVLSAQRSLLSSRESLAQSQRDIANDLVALYKALGGGW